MTRYTIGSMIAAASSAVAFALLYVLNVGTTVCSVAAFVAGAIPNWSLNRRWTWQRQGRPLFAREILPYTIISIVSLVTTATATAWTNSHVQSIPAHHGIRALLVTASYMAVVAVLFVAKFGIYEYWLFSEHGRVRAALRSLRQVPRTARANRIP
jgi:putative flippase GtrA